MICYHDILDGTLWSKLQLYMDTVHGSIQYGTALSVLFGGDVAYNPGCVLAFKNNTTDVM